MDIRTRVIFSNGPVWLQTVAGDGTEILLGEIVSAPAPGDPEGWICLRRVSYVGNTGRHHSFAAGKLDAEAEIECYPEDLPVDVQVRHVIRAARWPSTLPSKSK